MLAHRQFAHMDIMTITLTPARPMVITGRSGLQTAYSLAWARGTTGIGVIPVFMAGASTVAAGAIAASADVAGIVTVFEAVDLRMKALGAAASTVAVNFMVAADSTEVVKAFMAAGDFMAVATEAAMGADK